MESTTCLGSICLCDVNIIFVANSHLTKLFYCTYNLGKKQDVPIASCTYVNGRSKEVSGREGTGL